MQKVFPTFNHFSKLNQKLSKGMFNVSKNMYEEASKYLQQPNKIVDYDNKEDAKSIETLIVYYSRYINRKSYKDKNDNSYKYAEVRKFFDSEKISDNEKAIMMEYILNKIPECVNNVYKPALNGGRNPLALFCYYNDSGKHINEIAGLYPIFTNDSNVEGILSMRQAKVKKDAMEMTLYLTNDMRNRGFESKIISNTIQSSFQFNDNPLSVILFTWKPENVRIEAILQKMGIKINGKFVGNSGVEWMQGSITRKDYLKSLTNYDSISSFRRYAEELEKQRQREKRERDMFALG